MARIGISILLLNPVERDLPLFIMFFQVNALALAAGSASSLGPPWTIVLWAVLLWLISPLALHFHFHFPQVLFDRFHPSILRIAYGVAVVGIVGSLIREIPLLRSSLLYNTMSVAARINLVVCLLLSVALLFYSYRHPVVPGARGKIRLIALGGAISVLPFVLVGVLPDILSMPMVIPYPFVFFLLIIWGLTYGYAILRPSLARAERYISRATAQVVVFIVFGSFIFLTLAIVHFSGVFSLNRAPIIGTFVVFLIAVLFLRVRTWLVRLVTVTFYGSWHDYRSVVRSLTEGLENFTEIQPLAGEVSRRLVDVFGLRVACVAIMPSRNGDLFVEAYPASMKVNELVQALGAISVEDMASLVQAGDKNQFLWSQSASHQTLPAGLRDFMKEVIQVWVPITRHEQFQGLILLGNKRQGDLFSDEDIEVIKILASQMGPVIENIHLFGELREHAAELESRVEARTAELFDAKERVEAILASVGDGVLVTDLSGNILTANTAFQNKSGYQISEIVGQELSTVFDHKNDPGLIEGMQTAVSNGHAWSGELVSRSKTGDLYDILWTIAPLRDRAGQITGYVGSQQDISRQKEVDRVREQFMSNVSHDLRTPITTVCLYLDLLESATPEMRPKLLGALKGQSYLLRGMVEDILDFDLLLQQKKKGGEFEKVDLKQLTKEIVATQVTQAEMADIHLILPDSDCACVVWGEPKQLSRMIYNLLSNAIRYTPPGGEVAVRLSQEKDTVCLEVGDTGIGIDAVDLPYIFDRFYRGHNVSRSHKVGTGLGLAIVDEVVKLHGGTIEVESQVDKGTLFRVSLHAYGE